VRLNHIAVTFMRARRIRGLSQGELAAKSGVHRNTISGLESATRSVGLETVLALSEALDVPLSKLFRMAEEAAPK
jgi:transcriptional regulator with XRE-family HTH domain